jgi:hypothetical protein
MKVEDKRGVVLDFSEPINGFDLIKVTHCKAGQKPERIGSVERKYDELTKTNSYQAYNEYHEPMGKPTTDWKEVEFRYQKYYYEWSRTGIERAYIRMVNRSSELLQLREEKNITSRELNR